MTQGEAEFMTVEQVIAELREGVRRLDEVLSHLADDPGHAFAEATWLGMRVAEHCQHYAEGYEHEEAGDVRSFLSLDGALFRRNGELMSIEDSHFPVIRMAALADQGAPAAG